MCILFHKDKIYCFSSAALLFFQLCRSVARQYQEREMYHMRTEKEELLRLKKIASVIAKEVKHFWDSIQKVGCET